MVASALTPLSLQVVLDRNGVPIPGARLAYSDAGTTSPRPTYADRGLTLLQPSPVLADAFGRLPAMFVGTGDYRMVLSDAYGAQMAVVDGVPGAVELAAATKPTGTTLPTGMVAAAHGNDVLDGWLPLNALTIGAPGSAASARANNDVQALYVYLWNNDASLTVLGGRGLSASADWAGGKTLALPDYRGRSPFGRDAMGSTSSGLLTSLGNQADVTGTTFGKDTVALTINQLPPHGHNAAVTAAGGHTHAGNTQGDSTHSHQGQTNNSGDHQHNYRDATNSFVGRAGQDSNAYAPAPATNQTGNAGNHNHTVAVGPDGQHSHSLNITPVADHTHAVTLDQTGGGIGHQNMPPGILVTWHIKL